MYWFSKRLAVLVFCLGFLNSCNTKNKKDRQSVEPVQDKAPIENTNAVTAPAQKLIDQHAEAKLAYEEDKNNADKIIWYGRRTAYLANYEEAIKIYTEGIQIFPADPRFYRHRGHRYISLRKFDKAIGDLEKAAELIQGTRNQIEPDGMPNAQNIPVSSLHGNIWYHLGLAYYLKHDYAKAYKAYLNCRDSGGNPDNVVSSTHWLYMIQRRLGNNRLADSLLSPIRVNLEIIENTNYYTLCKFYKGLVPRDSLLHKGSQDAASDAIKYGLANWYFYNEDKGKSRAIMEDLLKGERRSSFGYIAAESDLNFYFN